MWIGLISLFLLIGMMLDVKLRKYEYTNSYLNTLLAFVMIFGHPLYFMISFYIAYFIDKSLAGDPLFNQFTCIGYFILVLSALIFGLLRYLLYPFLFKETLSARSFFEYWRFYIFTIFGMFLYLSVINTEPEFYMPYMFQLLIPVLLMYVVIYLSMKFLVNRLRNKHANA